MLGHRPRDRPPRVAAHGALAEGRTAMALMIPLEDYLSQVL